MNTKDLIIKYFPDLTEHQLEQFQLLEPLYKEWNQKINVISRKDIDELYERHVLHSLGIAKVVAFIPETRVLDVGTGGGFPGIPLAILFPEVQFHLVDSIGKKIIVVKEIAQALGLANLQAQHIRAEEVDGIFDFVVSRAVTQITPFFYWVNKKFSKKNNNSLPNGILYLKGGDIKEEFTALNRKYKTFELSQYFEEPFFETKKVMFVSAS